MDPDDDRFHSRSREVVARVDIVVRPQGEMSARQRVEHVRELVNLLNIAVTLERELGSRSGAGVAARQNVGKAIGILSRRIRAMSDVPE